MKFETNLNFVIYPSYPSAGGVDGRRASFVTNLHCITIGKLRNS